MKKILIQMFFHVLKRNPKFQGIFSWILQILPHSSQDRPKVFCKKGILKNFATFLFAYYWNRYQVVDSNQSKSVKILISEKTSLFFNISLWKSLFSADQQSIKKVCWNGMVSTNNLQRIYSVHSPDLQFFLVEAMPRYVFD